MNNLLFMVANPLGGVFKGSFSSAGANIKSVLSKFMWGIFIFIILGIITYFIYRWYKNKTVYTTPVSLTVLRENGMAKTRHDLKGGMFWNKGIKDYKIQIPKQRKAFTLGYIPDLSMSSSVDGRIHFITSGDQTIWQQVKEEWILTEKKVEDGIEYEYSLVQKPITREIKQVTVNSIKNWRDVVDKSKLTAFGIAIGAFLIMVIAHLISLFIQTRLKCGVPA